MEHSLETILVCAGLANFICLAAGAQAPSALNWREDLQNLSAFNRKIFWNYYLFIGGLVAAWGIISLIYSEELVSGEPLAQALLWLMFLFWSARLVVDFVWFEKTDWPTGKYYKIGRYLLTLNFTFLVCAYLLAILISGGQLEINQAVFGTGISGRWTISSF